ncbi:DUF2075 domain-containing protein [Actinocorallia sp. API 0066]|uniref:DNA/RNA helicase domain-containing protein n=1 Tax=Actinocorallia sp. API 0066 TaxID=2896846 RepID=UPI001E2A5E5E|nr:DNA/RNA helicase domain-containing protein [Actinocorallia sp. API 0066]MCD0448032.1 DUF2075 domain-containing protein [Actinocorallia sp. API 0066]
MRTLREELTSPSVSQRAFVRALSAHYKEATGRTASPGQKKAWVNSLSSLTADLMDAGLDRLEMIVEYVMPTNKSSQADVVLAGVDRLGRDVLMVVELKQWGTVTPYEDDASSDADWAVDGEGGPGPELFVVPGLPTPQAHPLDQLEGYCSTITHYCGMVGGREEVVHGVVYLHDAQRSSVEDLFRRAPQPRRHIFTADRRGEFIRYLREVFAPEPGWDVADRFLSGVVVPSPALLDMVADIVAGRRHFTLLDQQVDAYNAVEHAVRSARSDRARRVVVVVGRAGSGKTAIALELLGRLSGRGIRVELAAGSAAMAKTVQKELAGNRKGHAKLVNKFHRYVDPDRELDVLIVDEAHRARDRTRIQRHARYTSDEHQLRTLIKAARVTVFLTDHHQSIRPNECGTVTAIKNAAQELDVHFYPVIELEQQWRCGGSSVYEGWLRAVLGLGAEDLEARADRNVEKWPGDPSFDVKIASSPAVMEDFLRSKIEAGQSARIAAGYCWRWDKNPEGELTKDVRIGDWERPWNSPWPGRLGNVPPSSLWASQDGGFDQIGCVYTAQGLEYDWAGVIIGDDLVARGGRLVVDRNKNADQVVRASQVSDERFDQLIRNTYYILLTRGLRGVVICSTDEETRAYLRDLIGGSPEACLD